MSVGFGCVGMVYRSAEIISQIVSAFSDRDLCAMGHPAVSGLPIMVVTSFLLLSFFFVVPKEKDESSL